MLFRGFGVLVYFVWFWLLKRFGICLLVVVVFDFGDLRLGLVILEVGLRIGVLAWSWYKTEIAACERGLVCFSSRFVCVV